MQTKVYRMGIDVGVRPQKYEKKPKKTEILSVGYNPFFKCWRI